MTAGRLKLGDPRPDRPGDFLLLQQVCTEIRTLLRHKRNVGEPWNYDDTFVEVTPGESTYQINVANFGIPMAVLTSDPSNPNHYTRVIPFYSPANIYYDYALPENFGAYLFSPDGSQSTALRCSFFWRNNQPYIEFLPTPYLVAAYRIRYLMSANGVNDQALTQSPLSEEDCDLVVVRLAKHLLPNTEWNAPDTLAGQNYNSNKRKEMFMSFTDEERNAKEQFDAAQLLTASGRIHTRWDCTTI